MTAALDTLVSVCAVVGNDSGIVAGFVREVTGLLAAAYPYYELILIDNQSGDGSYFILRELQLEIPNLRVLRLSRPAGREVALTVAIENCIGDCVVLLDMRCDPPAGISQVVRRLLDGVDVVIGQHGAEQRGLVFLAVDTPGRKLATRILGVPFLSGTGSFCGFTRRAAAALIRIRSQSRFFLYHAMIVGYPREVFRYELLPGTQPHRPSAFSQLGAWTETIVANSPFPLRLAALLGVTASLMNLGYLGYIVAVAIVKRHVMEGWITTSVTNTTMFLLLFLILTVLAEYIARILKEGKNHPVYFVEEESSSTVSSYNRDRLNVL